MVKTNVIGKMANQMMDRVLKIKKEACKQNRKSCKDCYYNYRPYGCKFDKIFRYLNELVSDWR